MRCFEKGVKQLNGTLEINRAKNYRMSSAKSNRLRTGCRGADISRSRGRSVKGIPASYRETADRDVFVTHAANVRAWRVGVQASADQSKRLHPHQIMNRYG
jgi:hypothetical protein